MNLVKDEGRKSNNKARIKMISFKSLAIKINILKVREPKYIK